METNVAEVAPYIYRLSTFVSPPGLVFNQFLIDADEPLLPPGSSPCRTFGGLPSATSKPMSAGR